MITPSPPSRVRELSSRAPLRSLPTLGPGTAAGERAPTAGLRCHAAGIATVCTTIWPPTTKVSLPNATASGFQVKNATSSFVRLHGRTVAFEHLHRVV